MFQYLSKRRNMIFQTTFPNKKVGNPETPPVVLSGDGGTKGRRQQVENFSSALNTNPLVL